MSARPRTVLARVSALEAGRALVVPHAGPPPRRSILIVQTSDGIRAFWNVCQHLPVPLGPENGSMDAVDGLVCRAHGARYTLNDGFCFSGPCRGQWLESVGVVVEGDEIVLV